ncbi:response regulator [Clostridium sp. AL.422]|uniref:response regulator transcription factor n=1 Tax=Clostridium TaxID=1485 RepID=UPI00293DD99C|nr:MULTISPECIES: response regulator [unclassified Clostridium]MDV4151038.1 response regulator [Clostridium sp. AL.422]
MIKTLIVDDEPFIRQGLKVLIDWEKYGYKIVDECENGLNAIEKIKEKEIDLVITDIRMPKMDGLELIESIIKITNREINFIVLSGFSEFEYARKAIKYNVQDYILKPIQREELITSLLKIQQRYKNTLIEKEERQNNDKLVYDKYLSELILGLYDKKSLNYIKNRFNPQSKLRYINIEVNYNDNKYLNLSHEEKRLGQHKLYKRILDWLGNDYYNVVFDVINEKDCYDIGFIYEKRLSREKNISEKEYISQLINHIREGYKYDFLIYIGQEVFSLEELEISYKSSIIARMFSNFSIDHNISYYDDIINNNKSYSIEIKYMDDLIKAIDENNRVRIIECVDNFYSGFKNNFIDLEIITININYLLCNLIIIAKNIDENVDQQKIVQDISLGIFKEHISRGSSKHLKKFSLEFSNYLAQIRQSNSQGILHHIDKEISEHYMEKLSLKSLGEKYYINSAYLGQVFKKQYNMSFKDYLNSYRVDRAEELLINSDEKIYKIAELVGYNNTDYFINKFVQLKGKTPLQYRKKLKV